MPRPARSLVLLSIWPLLAAGCSSIDLAHRIRLEKRIGLLGDACARLDPDNAPTWHAEAASIASDVDLAIDGRVPDAVLGK